MKLICGLGNPGRHYRNHRHNIGFQVIEELCRRLDLTGLVMNLSGEALVAAVRFFKIAAEDTLVIHDELDLPFGRIQLKQQGGSGGHNGLNSIIECWGTSDFARLRFGIGRPLAGSSQEDVVEYVLSDFDPEQRQQLEIIDRHRRRGWRRSPKRGDALAEGGHDVRHRPQRAQ